MFEPNRDFACKKLINFINNNLSEYSKLRNFSVNQFSTSELDKYNTFQKAKNISS